MKISVDDLIARMKWMATRDVAEFRVTDADLHLHLLRTSLTSTARAQSEPLPKPSAQELNPRRVITAPLSGQCFLAPDAGTEPFVTKGAAIKSGQVVCIIEAMKVMTSVPAEEDGTVEAILVSDGDMVEAGTPLLRMAP